MGAIKDQLLEAEEYVQANIVDLCKEAVIYRETGIIPHGKIRIVRNMCSFAYTSRNSLADNLIAMTAINLVSEMKPD